VQEWLIHLSCLEGPMYSIPANISACHPPLSPTGALVGGDPADHGRQGLTAPLTAGAQDPATLLKTVWLTSRSVTTFGQILAPEHMLSTLSTTSVLPSTACVAFSQTVEITLTQHQHRHDILTAGCPTVLICMRGTTYWLQVTVTPPALMAQVVGLWWRTRSCSSLCRRRWRSWRWVEAASAMEGGGIAGSVLSLIVPPAGRGLCMRCSCFICLRFAAWTDLNSARCLSSVRAHLG
jgi:hypothetical protein